MCKEDSYIYTVGTCRMGLGIFNRRESCSIRILNWMEMSCYHDDDNPVISELE